MRVGGADMPVCLFVRPALVCQRRRWSSRTMAASFDRGRGPAVWRNAARSGCWPSSQSCHNASRGSAVAIVQPHFFGEPFDGTGELHSPGVGLASQAGGNLVPGQALGAEIGDGPLFVAKAVANALEQFSARQLNARGRLAAGNAGKLIAAALLATMIASLPGCLPRRRRE